MIKKLRSFFIQVKKKRSGKTIEYNVKSLADYQNFKRFCPVILEIKNSLRNLNDFYLKGCFKNDDGLSQSNKKNFWERKKALGKKISQSLSSRWFYHWYSKIENKNFFVNFCCF